MDKLFAEKDKTMLHIEIIAYNGCTASGVEGFADVFAVAEHAAGCRMFDVRRVGRDGAPVRPFAGPLLNVDGRAGDHDPNEGKTLVYVPPAVGHDIPPAWAVEYLRRRHKKEAVVCAACFGVFFQAEAGLLDGREATTHWGLEERFRTRYPAVPLDTRRMLIDHGDLICAGGLNAFYDLALHAVARFASLELAARCARIMLLDPGRTDQTPYASLLVSSVSSSVTSRGHNDPLTAQAQEWLEREHTRPLKIRDMADELHCGERTLLRRFKKNLGRTPTEFLRALRMEHAKRLLESSADSAEEIAEQVGYTDTPAFFRVFRKMTGLTPGEYRARFGMGNHVRSS